MGNWFLPYFTSTYRWFVMIELVSSWFMIGFGVWLNNEFMDSIFAMSWVFEHELGLGYVYRKKIKKNSCITPWENLS